MSIACPSCGERDALRGVRDGDLIAVRCETCGHGWERDPRPACPRCGGSDMRPVPKAIMQKARGNQRSITATVIVHLCGTCDAEAIEAHLRSGAPLMPDELPPPRDS